MTVTFHLPSERPLDLVRFAWSPLFEAVLSVRVVADPQRTPMHLPWARRGRELLDDALRDEIRELILPLGGYVPGIFEVGLRSSSGRFDDDVAGLTRVDEAVVAHELAIAMASVPCDPTDEVGPARLDDAAYVDTLFASVAGDADRTALLRSALDDPAALLDRYVGVLTQYWDAAFAEEWDRILPRIEREVTDAAHALVTRGAPGLVGEMLPEGRWDAEASAIVVNKDWDGSCDVAERGGLLFVPTVYGWPCVLIELSRPWPLSIIFPLRDLRQPHLPHASDGEVVDGLRALGDETRLQIARLVTGAARSTKEIAELLSLSDSAISRHLKIMESAGLVTSRRDGYFVLYQLRAERLEVLSGALRATLGLDASTAGTVPALPVTVGRVPVG